MQLTAALFTISYGMWCDTRKSSLVRMALRLKPAPGNQEGIYFTAALCQYDVFALDRVHSRKGNISAGPPPAGPMELFAFIAFSIITTYSSSSDVTVCPYTASIIIAIENLCHSHQFYLDTRALIRVAHRDRCLAKSFGVSSKPRRRVQTSLCCRLSYCRIVSFSPKAP